MKKLIFLFFVLSASGIISQELALSNTGRGASSSTSSELSTLNSNTNLVNGLDGLSDKKLINYLKKEGATEKLIEKGNEYFDKMWYAEAARVFDIVLEETDAAHTYSLLLRAGDSNYYTGNLEKSYQWYNELYQKYETEIQEDTYFRYTQTLKGTGKYQRASAVTKLLRQKRDEPLRELKSVNVDTWKGATTVKIKNLEINSPYSDFSPMYYNGSDIVYASAKDSSVLISRKYRWTNQPFLDLYVAQNKNDDGDLGAPKKFSKNINTKYHEASLTFSPDQKTIYFTRNNYGKRLKRGKNGINHLKIYRSINKDGKWTKAEELPFNGENFSTGHPAVSTDGKKMYFVSDRPGGFGETDIYMVDILENGSFSEPQNLGRTVNTESKEMFPYVTDNALYFSSNRPMGFGGLDIYKSDGANTNFSVGINLGQPINSSRDDFSYIIDSSREKGYFASNRKGGKGDDDIYSFAYSLNLNAVSGSVEKASSKDPIDNARIQLLDGNNNPLQEATTDSKGRYTINYLSPLTDYTVVAMKEGFGNDSISLKTKENETIAVAQYLKELEPLKPEPITASFEPNNVHFRFDSFEITPQAAKELDKLIIVLKENKSLDLKIESHTDAVGPKNYNKYLSDRRAKSTRDYIVSQGVDPSRIISAMGYGEERLLNNCGDGQPCTSAQQRQNRRSEFILISR